MKTRKWSEIKARKLSPEAHRRVAEQVDRTVMRLNALRRARGLTQDTLAEAMDVNQSYIAKLEKQTDVYLSTLRRFVEAMDGELLVVARFPDGEEVGVTLNEDDEPPIAAAGGRRR
jgi:transcriptional regulator with XRE-family HTH domain